MSFRFVVFTLERAVVFSFYKLGPFGRYIGSREGTIVIEAFIYIIYIYTQWQSSPGNNNNNIMYKSRRKLLRRDWENNNLCPEQTCV